MGAIQAREMLDQAGLDQALAWHLQGNHYPPVPVSMVPACKKAIEIATEAYWGDASLNDLIELPSPITWRGETHAPARAIIEAHHLDAFINPEGDEE